MLASPLSHPRVGLIVPLHRHTAVDRNRLKRRMRELVRTELLPRLRQLAPLDISIRANAEAYALRHEELRAEVLAIRAHVTKGASGP